MTISNRLLELRSEIDRAASLASRNPCDVHLLAVSKTFPLEAIHEAFAAGQRHFGENYVQEARDKYARFSPLLTGETVEVDWHLIGPLQRNKVNMALEMFSYFHSVDSLRLLQAIDQRALRIGKRPKVLLQVRLGDEESKHGFLPDELLPMLQSLHQSPPQSVDLVGLMTIPPPVEDAEDNRPHFRHLRLLAEQIRTQDFPFFQEFQLSMGMSDDFRVAIQEGATWIRIGRALFGHRPVKA